MHADKGRVVVLGTMAERNASVADLLDLRGDRGSRGTADTNNTAVDTLANRKDEDTV